MEKEEHIESSDERGNEQRLEHEHEAYWASLVAKYQLGDVAQAHLQSLRVSLVNQDRISETQQRSVHWFHQRQHRITASNFGAALGHSPYERPLGVVKKMLWPQANQSGTFQAQQWGIDHEDQAVALYVKYMQKQVHPNFAVAHQGLYVSQKYCFLGGSPDGVVMDPSLPPEQQRGLLEIKCPFKKTLYPEIPVMYYDQIMGIMGLMQLTYADFVVWTPTTMQIRRFEFNAAYFARMLEQLEHLYFTEYMPRYLMKQAHLLAEGELDPVLHVSAWPTTAVSEEATPESKDSGL